MAYQKNEKLDVYQMITDRILQIMEKGKIPWQKPWSGGTAMMPINLVSKKHYHGINTILLGCQEYDSPYWLSFKQAQERGGHVRKGEKGTPCIFWKSYEKETENLDTGEIEISKKFVARYYTVFNADQCEGIEAPKIDIKIYPENERIQIAENIIQNISNKPIIEYKGNKAFYSITEDKVVVPEIYRFEKSEHYYSTLFHELTHSTRHEKRLNRDAVPHMFGSKEYAQEELVAEMGAAFLCGYCGIENQTIENSAAYIQGWANAIRQDKKLIVVAAAQAQKAANFILNIQTGE